MTDLTLTSAERIAKLEAENERLRTVLRPMSEAPRDNTWVWGVLDETWPDAEYRPRGLDRAFPIRWKSHTDRPTYTNAWNELFPLTAFAGWLPLPGSEDGWRRIKDSGGSADRKAAATAPDPATFDLRAVVDRAKEDVASWPSWKRDPNGPDSRGQDLIAEALSEAHCPYEERFHEDVQTTVSWCANGRANCFVCTALAAYREHNR